MKSKKPWNKPTLRKLTKAQIKKFSANLPEGVTFAAGKTLKGTPKKMGIYIFTVEVLG